MRDAESRFAHSTCITDTGRALDAASSDDVDGSGAPSVGLRMRALAGILAAAALVFAALAPAASAEDTGHAYSFSFKGSGTNELSSYITDVAVRQSNGDIYVADMGNYRIEVFDSSGNFKFMFGKEVNATTKGFTCTAAETCQHGVYANPPEGVYGVSALAIDQTTGAIYAGGSFCCPFSGYVEKFNADGTVDTSWQTNGFTNGANTESGAYEPYGLDTDAAGNLLVMAGYYPKRLVKYNPAGTTITEYPVNHEVSGGLAWSPQNFLYYSNGNYYQWNVRRMSETATNQVDFGEFWSEPGFQRYAYQPAVDRSTGDVYADAEISESNGENIIMEWQVDGTGQPIGCAQTLTDGTSGCPPTNQFGRSGPSYPTENAVGGLGSQTHVEVNSTTHALYATSTRPTAAGGYEGRINVYIKGKAPKAVTEAPTANKTVSGTAKPDGASNIVKCEFIYGPTKDYGSTAACTPAPPYAADQAVTANITANNESTYHYRLVVTNAEGGTAMGQDMTITPHNVLGVETLAAQEVKRASASLRGSYHGDGNPTEYWFKWGKTNSYGSESAPAPVPGVNPTYPPATEVSFTAPNLKGGTVYHYRVFFKNAQGVTEGTDKTFETPPAAVGVTTQPATRVDRTHATLHGTFQSPQTEGEGTNKYWIEYGIYPGYTKETATQTTTSTGAINVENTLSGLNYQTKYHYRLVVENELGKTIGNEVIFETNPAVSGVKTLPATEVSQQSVTLNGEFTGNGEETEYFFEYGPTTEYESKTEAINAGSGSGTFPIAFKLTSFQGRTEYHFRLVAKNAVGETRGEDFTFKTEEPELPAVSGGEATNVGPTSATLSAMVDPNRWDTVYAFDYGPTTSYGSSTVLKNVIEGTSTDPTPVSALLTELTPGTTYHFRVVAINLIGTTHGPDMTFTTPDRPSIESIESSGVTYNAAHLNATVSPNASPTTVHFEYGTSGFDQRTPETSPVGSDRTIHAVGVDISGLSADTTYHYRVVATNAVGSVTSSEGTFTTGKAPAGEEPQPKPLTCKKGFVKRHGKCVKKHRRKHHKHHKRHGHRSGGNG